MAVYVAPGNQLYGVSGADDQWHPRHEVRGKQVTPQPAGGNWIAAAMGEVYSYLISVLSGSGLQIWNFLKTSAAPSLISRTKGLVQDGFAGGA